MRVWSAIFTATLGAALACGSNNKPPPNETIDGSSQPPGDGGNDGSTIDGPSAADACQALATAKCTKLMTCSATDLERKYGTIAQCETREALSCADEQMVIETSATPAQAEACGSAITASACADFLGATAPAACLPQPGPGAGGCAFGGECSTTYCALGAEALCGQCRTIPTTGTSCAASECGNGQVCADGSGGNNECVTPGAGGAQCNEDAPCGNGFTCVGRTKNSNGTCDAEVTNLGGTCDALHNSHADCSADDGLGCNTQSNQCVAIGLAASGSPCGTVNNVKTVCTGGAECFIPTGKTAGTCSGPAGDGSACNVSTGPLCLTPSRCIPTGGTGSAGTCQLPGSMSCE